MSWKDEIVRCCHICRQSAKVPGILSGWVVISATNARKEKAHIAFCPKCKLPVSKAMEFPL